MSGQVDDLRQQQAEDEAALADLERCVDLPEVEDGLRALEPCVDLEAGEDDPFAAGAQAIREAAR